MNLFLLPHQDDEMPMLNEIEQAFLAHNPADGPLIVYLTQSPDRTIEQKREQESLKVLTSLGALKNNIYFLGKQERINDCSLIEHLDDALEAILTIINGHHIRAIHVPAYEGGHPDHDAACILAASLRSQDPARRIFQYPYYHGKGLPGGLFRALSPLNENGPIEKKPLSFRKRLRYFSKIFSYPTQVITWIGLGPFLLIHYIFSGTQVSQGLASKRLQEKPHEGKLYYERRGFYQYAKFHEQAQNFLQTKNL